jgi:hypothetical protein
MPRAQHRSAHRRFFLSTSVTSARSYQRRARAASRPANPALTTTTEDRLEVLAGEETRRLVFRHHGSVHFAALSIIVSSQLWLGGTGITSHADWLLSKNVHSRLRSFAAEDLFLACARNALVFRALARQKLLPLIARSSFAIVAGRLDRINLARVCRTRST